MRCLPVVSCVVSDHGGPGPRQSKHKIRTISCCLSAFTLIASSITHAAAAALADCPNIATSRHVTLFAQTSRANMAAPYPTHRAMHCGRESAVMIRQDPDWGRIVGGIR